MTGAVLGDQIAALAEMEIHRLRTQWQRHYRASPPRLSPELMRLALAYKMQEQVHGGLTAKTRRRLRSLGKRLEAGDVIDKDFGVRLKPGATLVREWHGRTHTVRVLEGGFEYAGRRHRSLSRVAAEITGARWSGPRFFGLTRAAEGSGATSRGDNVHG